MKNAFRLFGRQCLRELLLHARQPRSLLYSTLFFLMMLIFFPLTLRPEPALLRQIAPGLLWTAMLLALILASERLFQQDYEEGVIEQWLISGESVVFYVSAKACMHWLLNLLPMIFLSPLIAILFSLTWQECLILIESLILGSPAILFLCALAAAFSTGIGQKGVLIALVLLPLAIPVMIFGSATLSACLQGMAVGGYLAILLALSLLAVAFLPLAIAAILRTVSI